MIDPRLIEKRKNADGSWNLYVHGELVVVAESLGVVEGIEEALKGHGDPTSELAEVAHVIERRER